MNYPVCGKEARAHIYYCAKCAVYLHEKCWQKRVSVGLIRKSEVKKMVAGYQGTVLTPLCGAGGPGHLHRLV